MALDQLTPAQRRDLDEILAECKRNTMFMANLLYPEEFCGDMTSLHRDYFDFVDNCDAPRKCAQVFRGFGKTTINKLLVRKAALFEEKSFIGYLTNSGEVAQTIVESIKMGLVANANVRKIFGDVRESKIEGVDEKWAQKSSVIKGLTCLLPRGYGQQVNGLLWGYYRPDLWIIDDLDDRIEVRNDEQRKKLRDWFYGALMYTISIYKRDGKIPADFMYTDTIKHADGLICHLMEDPDWESISLSVCDEDYKTKIPSIVSQEDLDAEIESHRRNKTMDVFARERMGLSQSKEYGQFKAEYFKYYDENDEEFVKVIRPRLINILIHDPSKTKNPTSAHSGFVVWGLDLEYNMFYERFCLGDFMSIKEQYDKIMELANWFRVQAFGSEVTGLEDHLVYNLKNEFLRNNMGWLAACFIPLKARSGKGELTGFEGGKEGRINLLLPFYEKGLISHNKDSCGQLEQQLLGSRLRDVADCAAYLPQMLAKGAKYMAVQGLENEDPMNVEQEYAQLTNDMPMQRVGF